MAKTSFLLDEKRREVFVNGREILMPPGAFDVLVILVEADRRIVSRDEIIKKLARRAEGSYCIQTRTVDQHIKRLRTALGAPGLITTVVRYGYKFRRPV